MENEDKEAAEEVVVSLGKGLGGIEEESVEKQIMADVSPPGILQSNNAKERGI